jgi:hypothetical protein
LSWATALDRNRPPLLRVSLSSDRFIVSPGYDALFFIGSPLLAILVVLGAWRFLPAVTIEGTVALYLAVGHHVPTFLRAYGDPDEYTRNRFRLLTIPALVLPLVALSYLVDSRLLGLIFIWDQYHFIRQHYGFMRIYDVKNPSAVKPRRNLDQVLCFALFAAIITHSDFYSFVYTGAFADLGIVFPGWLGTFVRDASLVVAIAVVLSYVFEHVQHVRAGGSVSVLKLALTGTTYGCWYFSYVVLSHPALSYPISSFFHCLQYDAFAWHYNQKKAQSLEPKRGNAIFRYIHARRHAWLYLGAIGAYGFGSHIGSFIEPGVVFVVNRTTALLHYYFDSFIWRVRRPEFRKHL